MNTWPVSDRVNWAPLSAKVVDAFIAFYRERGIVAIPGYLYWHMTRDVLVVEDWYLDNVKAKAEKESNKPYVVVGTHESFDLLEEAQDFIRVEHRAEIEAMRGRSS